VHELFEFAHPLVRAAVYEAMDPVHRRSSHDKAACALTAANAPAEQIAAHLLKGSPTAGTDVAMLRQAAAEATQRGSPGAAQTYLRHALRVCVTDDDRRSLLRELAQAEVQDNLPAAVDHLSLALALTEDPMERGRIVASVGLAMLWVGRVEDVVAILVDTIDRLPPAAADLQRRLEAMLLTVPIVASGWSSVIERLGRLTELPQTDTVDAALLDGMIACHEVFVGEPHGTERARRVLASPGFARLAAAGPSAAIGAYWGLMVGDLDDGITAYDSLIGEAQTQGSTITLAAAHLYRGMGWFLRGELAEAEHDLRESLQLQLITSFGTAEPVALGWLAEVLLDQGRLTEAETTLRQANIPTHLPRTGLLFYPLHAKARLLRARGDYGAAFATACAAGDRLADHGGRNPAVVAWRSEAALSLHAMGHDAEARTHAREELELARAFRAAHAIGHALRVLGLITPFPSGLDHLEEATQTLRKTSAHLELAKSLADLGAGLRRSGQRSAARSCLTEAIELAHRCGAQRLTDRMATELRIAGWRPRNPTTVGPKSLTPSERRVAELAAAGHANRDIAQLLFETIKTVEVHLSSTYRKLGITSRRQLAEHLRSPS